MNPDASTRKPVVIGAGEGRDYPMGAMRAIFKADRTETANRYSVSEWWMDARTGGPDQHAHDEDHVFYVIEGTVSVQIDGQWLHLDQGSYAIIPGGTPHSFQNQSMARAGFISFNTPGGFEERMPDIAAALSAADLRI